MPRLSAQFLPGLILALLSLARAESFTGFDDFAGDDGKWAYAFRSPPLTVGTNGELGFSGSVLHFTKGPDRGSYLLGWDGDGGEGTSSRDAASYTTSWVAEISATNLHQPEAGAFSSVGFEVALAPNAYTEITLENSGGSTRVRTETNSASTGVASAVVSTNVDVRLRISWDAGAKVLSVGYSVDAGASFVTLRNVPISEWPVEPTGGFYFELMGYSIASAPIAAGQMQIDDFSITAVPPDYVRLSNVSVRNLTAEGERTLIVGYSVEGRGVRPLVLRAVSETIGALYGVPDVLTDVDLALYAAGSSTAMASAVAVNAGMSGAFSRVGAFPLDGATTDAALLRSLPAGTYTAHAIPAPGAAKREGATLLEVYEDGRLGTRLTNVSARTEIGASPLIVGFAVSGPRSARVLIRAVGPGLAAFGVTNFVGDPRLSVVRMSSGATIAQNDNWAGAAAVTEAITKTGAFGISAGGNDAAIALDLEPGTYSVLVEKTGTATGIVLAEVYLVP